MWWWWAAIGRSRQLDAGCCHFIPPGVEHSYGYETGEHIAIHFDLHAQPELVHPHMIESCGPAVSRNDSPQMPWYHLHCPARPEDPGLLIPAMQAVDGPRVEERMRRLIALLDGPGANALANQIRAGSLILELLLELSRPATAQPAAADPRILHLLADIPSNAQPSISSLAHRCGLSESAFRSAFVRSTGETPHRFFERRRIATAIQMLRETSMGISAIASALGYDDPFHFSRVCKRVSGQAPSAWRHQEMPVAALRPSP
jgi:AraC-like DNA-binding protein